MPERANEPPVPPRKLTDYLLSQGRSAITVSEAAELLGLSRNSATAAMTKLRHAGEFFSPHPGLYLPIPPQFRSWGVIPGTDLIDIYMRALGRRYYVALLSAAELWGAAHQRPQTFQVVVDKPIADKDFDRVKLRFYTSARAATVATVERSSAAGRYYVSSPAVTLLDLADRPRECGGVNNVATVVHELASEQKIDGHELAGQALRFRRSAARRLGWLLAETGAPVDLAPLRQFAAATSGTRGTTLLDPTGPRVGRTDPLWRVVLNTQVEADL